MSIMRTPRGLGDTDTDHTASLNRHTSWKSGATNLDCDAHGVMPSDHGASRPGAREPLHRRASLHAFIRGRELVRTAKNTSLRPGVRDFVSCESETDSFSDDDERDSRDRRAARGRFGTAVSGTSTHREPSRARRWGILPIATSLDAFSEDLDDEARREVSPPFVVRFCRGDDGADAENGNERLLAVADEEGVVTIADVNQSLPRSFSEHRDRDGRFVPKQRWMAHENAVFDVQWCRGGSRMYTASGDQTVRQWDVETAAARRRFTFHRGSVKAVSVRPGCGGDVFASCGRDGAFALWDVRERRRSVSGRSVPRTGGNFTAGTPGSVSPDAPVAAVERAHEWRARSGTRATAHAPASRRESSSARFVRHAAYRAPTRAASSLDVSTRATTSTLCGFPSADSRRGVASLAFAHDGQLLLTAGAADGVVKIWDVRRLERGNPVAEMVDGDPGAKAGGFSESNEPNDASNERKNVSGRRRGVTSLALAPGGSTRVAVSYSDAHVSLFDHNAPFAGPTHHLRGERFKTSFYVKTAFSPCGTHLASGSGDANVYVWRVDRPLDDPAVLAGHQGEVSAVDWSPTEFGCLASCADDGVARVWAVDRAAARSKRRRRERERGAGEIDVVPDTNDWRIATVAETVWNHHEETASRMHVHEGTVTTPIASRDRAWRPNQDSPDLLASSAVRTPASARERNIRNYFSPGVSERP